MQWLGYFICKGQAALYAKVRSLSTQRQEDILPRGQVLFTQWYSSYLRKGHAVFSCEDQAIFYSVLRRLIFYIFLFKKFGLIAFFFRDFPF
jgi:hypothetical protein